MSENPTFGLSLMAPNHNAVGAHAFDYVSNTEQTQGFVLGSLGDAGH
jgi:hypothetical protein